MKIIDQNKVHFYGYKNVIHNNLKSDALQLMFMSMQLNNEDYNDLDEFKMIRQLEGKEQDSDVLNVLYSRIAGHGEYLFFDNKSMRTGDELKNMYELYGYTNTYKVEEKASLKAYTLLASITKRMMHNGLCATDSEFINVFKSSVESIVKLLGTDTSKIFTLIQSSVTENKQIEKTAEEFNNLIVKNMNKLFK